MRSSLGGRSPNLNTAAGGLGCLALSVWLVGVLCVVGFWGFVLYLAWKLVTHITGG